MKYAIMVLALVGVLASPRPAAANFTGNEMLNHCMDQSGFGKVLCVGYVIGFKSRDEISMKGQKKFICWPVAPIGQFQDVLVKYLRNNPEHRHNQITPLAWRAFTKAFPC